LEFVISADVIARDEKAVAEFWAGRVPERQIVAAQHQKHLWGAALPSTLALNSSQPYRRP
jgi:hypothetical protein